MKDFFGNAYVESRQIWQFWHWLSYAEKRTKAVALWLNNIALEIKALYPDAVLIFAATGESRTNWVPKANKLDVWTPSIGSKKIVSLTERYYDQFTLNKTDPIQWTIETLKEYKRVETILGE